MEGELSVGTLMAEVDAWSEISWFPDLLLFWFSMAKRNQRVFFGVISPKHGSLGLFKGGRHTFQNSLCSVLVWKIWTVRSVSNNFLM